MLCVGGWLKPHAPVSSGRRTSPAAWLVRTPKSVRPQRARCAVCVFVDGNSHSEAEVSNFKHWPRLSYLLVPGAHPEHARQARFCLRRGNQRKADRPRQPLQSQET